MVPPRFCHVVQIVSPNMLWKPAKPDVQKVATQSKKYGSPLGKAQKFYSWSLQAAPAYPRKIQDRVETRVRC